MGHRPGQEGRAGLRRGSRGLGGRDFTRPRSPGKLGRWPTRRCTTTATATSSASAPWPWPSRRRT
ncbi:hypothetical protein ACFFX0_22070 [Citricoccus parietis]|uniref:Uncharacterized protein n=1 Tax=Citricoccus parietis TaxID=592307 RepID=A0ABV5G472_9MICC